MQLMINGINLKVLKLMMILHYSWLKECKRILKKNGSIWVIGSYHNILELVQ